jgi:prepilin-type N-terminal cleavage/methylation domain-containing protein
MNLNNAKTSLPSFRPTGLTLVELLTAIMIIGLSAAFIVPQLSAVNEGDTQQLRCRRNAQEIANVFATAQAAGVDFTVRDNLFKTIRNVVAGGTPTEGAFKGQLFAVRGLAVQQYLSLEGDVLCFNSKGVK